MKKLIVLMLFISSCSDLKSNRYNEKAKIAAEQTGKWVMLAEDPSYYGLFRYEDKDVTCYIMSMSQKGGLQCFKK